MGNHTNAFPTEDTVGANGKPLLRDSKGAWRTLSLFHETNQTTTMKPVYTLKPTEWAGLPSLKALYLEIADPTEWEFALEAFGSWEHWQRLVGCEWFQEYLLDMRDTLTVKLRSEGLRKISQIAKGKSPGALNAARYLADRGWEPSKRGRPTKADVEKEKRAMAAVSGEVSADLHRIMN